PELFASSVELRKDLARRVLCRPRGEQQTGLKPARARAHSRHVIRIDMDRVPTDLFGGKCDGISFGDQILRAEIDDGAVLAEARADQYLRVRRAVEGDTGLEKIDGKFTGPEHRPWRLSGPAFDTSNVVGARLA